MCEEYDPPMQAACLFITNVKPIALPFACREESAHLLVLGVTTSVSSWFWALDHLSIFDSLSGLVNEEGTAKIDQAEPKLTWKLNKLFQMKNWLSNKARKRWC